MTEFTLRLKIPNAGNKEIYYSVELTGTDSSHPEDYFSARTDRGKANRLNLRQTIANQSLRQITDEQLEQIIHKWNYGIKTGKSNTTTVEISLEPYGGSSPPIPAPPVVQPIPPVVKPIAPVVQPPPGGTVLQPPGVIPVKQPQPPIVKPVGQNPPSPENPPVEPENSPPSVEERATDNTVDF